MIYTLLLLIALIIPSIAHSQAMDRTHVNYTNPLSYGSTCDATTMNATITAVGSTKVTIVIPRTDRSKANCTWTFASNVTFNINTTVYIPAGVITSPNSGITVTFNGPAFIDDVESLQGVGAYTFNNPQMSNVPSSIISGCYPTVPSSSTTIGTIPCAASINVGNKQFSFEQTTSTIGPLTGGDGTYWLIFDFSKTRTLAGWTRQGSTHYLWQKSASLPTIPNGSLLFAQVTIVGVVTAIKDRRLPLSFINHGVYDPSDPLYGADGNDASVDDTGIALAIAAVPDAGGVLSFSKAGTYLLGTGGILITGRTDFTMRCNAGVTIKVNAIPAVNHMVDFGVTSVNMVSCTRCKIENCKFDGNGTSYDVNTVGMNGNTESVFNNNTIVNAGDDCALCARANFRNRYTNNIIYDGQGDSARGMYIGNAVVPGDGSDHDKSPLIGWNTVYNMSATGIGGVMSDGARIEGNYSYGHINPASGSSGIVVASTASHASHDITIVGNVTYGNYGTGIQADPIPPDTISQITIVGNVSYGNFNSSSHGIYGVNLVDAVIANNIVYNNENTGIVLEGSNRVTVTGNNVFNTLAGGAPVQSTGISVRGTSVGDTLNIVVSNNIVSLNDDRGITLDTSGGGTMRNIIVTGNIAYDNTARGISVIPDSDNTMVNVIVKDNITDSSTNDFRVGTIATDRLHSIISRDNIWTTSDGPASNQGGISNTASQARNLRGNCTFVANVATCTVTFPFAEPDATYFVALGGGEAQYTWVSGKGTGGFTINRPPAIATTPVVDWMLIR